MTVKELIHALSTMPPQESILIETPDEIYNLNNVEYNAEHGVLLVVLGVEDGDEEGEA